MEGSGIHEFYIIKVSKKVLLKSSVRVTGSCIFHTMVGNTLSHDNMHFITHTMKIIITIYRLIRSIS